MKNNMIKWASALYLMSLMVACNPGNSDSSTTVVDKEQIKKEIQAREDEFAAVYNAGEMKSIGYYADDAISFTQNSEPLVGKPAIVEYLKANMDSITNNNKIAFTTNEVFVSDDGNLVVEFGSYKVVDSLAVLINSGHYMSLFEKRDGKYVVVRDMSTSDMSVQ